MVLVVKRAELPSDAQDEIGARRDVCLVLRDGIPFVAETLAPRRAPAT